MESCFAGVAPEASFPLNVHNKEIEMTAEVLILWLVVGLVSGWMASTLAGGGFGLIGDTVLGVVGALLGGILFWELGIQVPLGGMAGAIAVAVVGAASLLVLLRLFRRVHWA
jgi:uncharacterized membrane protein YeaQ/YmgE (transglycosylase-associated protein family)